MKKLIMGALTFLISLSFSISALAEDTPFVKLLGFSKDGRYMAFQETLVQDGSGYFRSIVRVLDVEKDKYIARSNNSFEDVESGKNYPFSKFVQDSLNKAAPILKKSGIDKSSGETVNISVAPRVSSFTYKNKYIGIIMNEKYVDITKETKYNPTEKLSNCQIFDTEAVPQPGHLRGYEINAYSWYSNKADAKDATLHSDKRIPNSRGCPLAYSMNSAFAHGDKVVILVAVKTFGFEGPDISYITVPFDISKF